MLLALGCLLLGLAAFVVAETRTLPARQRQELLRRAATYGALPMPVGEHGRMTSSERRVFGPLVPWVASCVLRVMPRTTRSTVNQRLLRAGIAHRIDADAFVAAKGLLAVTGLVFGVLVGAAFSDAAGLVFGVCLGGAGFVLPDIYTNARYGERRETIQAALPDALDLIATTVEAGLGFDGALAKLTESMEGPLVDEFKLALNEMRIGETRIEALKRMAARVDVPELSTFVRAVVQADQLGMSMGAMLRVQAADVRIRRQLAAEEKAMKMPIKMVFPMVFFLLPAMFIVIVGPFFLGGLPGV
jgi:tight adherence protein C